MLKLPENILNVLKILEKNGYRAYIVGGCVRDFLLGKTPDDYDVTTSATPEEITDCFERTVPTGIKHGTVTVISGKTPVEVTTFRTDGEYTDSRRPENVTFVTDIKADLARRDFTVNAMAYSEKTGLCDCFGGKTDLQNRVLRAVGIPEKRFSEDALRIMRLFRFASQLDFFIEENTQIAALKLAGNLKNISVERIFTELKKTVCGKNPSAVSPLIKSGALGFLGIKAEPDYSILCKLDDVNLAFFYFLSEASDNIFETLCKLNGSNSEKNFAKSLLRLTNVNLSCSVSQKEALNATSPDAVRAYLTLEKAKGKDTEKAEKLLKKIIESGEAYAVKHLKVDGKDCINAGLSGNEISEKLEDLRKKVISGVLTNERQILLDSLKN